MSTNKFVVPPDIRNELKTPLGRLFSDLEVTRELLNPYIQKSSFLVSVGDRTTERMHELGFSPNLEIIDMKERRFAREPPCSDRRNLKELRAVNEPGLISSDALRALRECIELLNPDSQERLRLVVTGEEDLLTLPVVAFFPEQTVVLYGQPHMGLVLVESTKSRQNAKQILHRIGIDSLKQ